MELIARLGEPGGEREERVTITRDGERWTVVVGDRVHSVDAVRLDGAARRPASEPELWSLIVDGVQHEVALTGAGAGGSTAWTVALGGSSGSAGRTERVEVADPLTHLAREAHEAASGGGPATVTAYMPGRVVAVLAAEGDEVAAGQGVVVLEAMKMENEIAAERAGIVGRLHVAPGQAVEGGDPLFDLEPLG